MLQRLHSSSQNVDPQSLVPWESRAVEWWTSLPSSFRRLIQFDAAAVSDGSDRRLTSRRAPIITSLKHCSVHNWQRSLCWSTFCHSTSKLDIFPPFVYYVNRTKVHEKKLCKKAQKRQKNIQKHTKTPHSHTVHTLCLKNDTDVAGYIFNAHQPILVVFGRDVGERVCYWMVICYPTSPN